MARYRESDYSLDTALWNINISFLHQFQEELKTYAQFPERIDLVEKIHNEWDRKMGLSAFGTTIRIEWAVAIYEHGDWEKALAAQKICDPSANVLCGDPRKNYPTDFRCDNGIYVRSLSELFIADWLYANRFMFEYEREVFFRSCQRFAHCDFYLSDYDTYIEFWGMNKNAQYLQYKQWKEPLYAANGYRLLSLDFHDLKTFRDSFTRKLQQIK